MKAVANNDRTHNPFDEPRWVSRLRENLTSGSYGEGLETGRASAQVPRQSLTRQLVFKELKSHYRLGELPTRKAPIVEALILATVITLLVSRRLLDAVRRKLRRQRHRVPEGRWASLFAAIAIAVLDLVLLPKQTAKALARRLEPMLLHEAADPNLSRVLLLERVDRGTAWVR